eukprot:3177521-Karenia_brevis.AAC.1
MKHYLKHDDAMKIMMTNWLAKMGGPISSQEHSTPFGNAPPCSPCPWLGCWLEFIPDPHSSPATGGHRGI